MNKQDECQMMIAAWYAGGPIVSVKMGGGDEASEVCITMLVVEMLRLFIDNPIPDSLREGSSEMDFWFDMQYARATRGLNFGLTKEQIGAVKNLAFNYWVVGIAQVQADPQLKARLFQCNRHQLETKQ